MNNPELLEILQRSIHDLLTWIGFGTVVGLAAKALMPGKDPGGAIGTMLMGVAGTFIGCGILLFFWDGARVTPISPFGFAAATGGAFLLLLFYRVFAGTMFVEAEDGDHWWHLRKRRSRKRRLVN